MELVFLLCFGGLILFAVVVVIYLWSTYNSLVGLRNRVREAWSGIDVQLKRRADLVPNLVETVKGYATHESGVFERVTQARSALMSAGNAEQAGQANNMLTGALKSLFAVAEAYPELKASANFQQLQGELSQVEEKIAYSRQYFNGSVLNYNTAIQTFPNVIIARNFGFDEERFFEADADDREAVRVSFS